MKAQLPNCDELRVTLVQPAVDVRFSSLDMTFTRLAPPTGLALLACETERRLGRKCNFRIYCAPLHSPDFIRTCADSDVLGISTWFSNYENGVDIARQAKHLNPDLVVVFGGSNASNLGERILLNRPEVDFVVWGDGEDVLWRILARQEAETIPNLWYRDELGRPVFTYAEYVNLDSIGLWDFRYNVDPQLEDYDFRRPGYLFRPDLPPIGLSMTRGCVKAVSKKGRCAYCTIPTGGLRTTSPDKVWAQVEHLQRLYGIEAFFETGDDFTIVAYVRRLAETKPSGIRFRLRVYASPWGLTSECVHALRELGVYEVFVGLETPDEEISRRVGHMTTVEQIWGALDRLAEAQISVCLSFLLGLPGETKDSVQTTVNFAERLLEKYSNIRMVLVSLAIPLVGSRWFERLLDNATVRTYYNRSGKDLASDDVFDYRRLLELSLQQEGTLTMPELLSALEELRARLRGKVTIGTFGGIEGESATTASPGST